MVNDDINILFAVCVAIVLLIVDSISRKPKEEQLIESDVQDVVEEKKEQTVE